MHQSLLVISQCNVIQVSFILNATKVDSRVHTPSANNNVATIVATNPEFLIAKDVMLAALVTVSVIISSP